MKMRFYLATCALLLAFAAGAVADQTADQYDMLMKPAIMANAALQKSVGGDLTVAASDATNVQNAFMKIEQYWAMHGAADGQMFAKNIEDAAKQAHDAAAAGNKDAATAAAKMINANCGMCHMAHRGKDADGNWVVK